MISDVTQTISWDFLPVPKRAALVLIDVQNGFVNESTRHVPAAVQGLLESRAQDFSLRLATKFFNPPNSPFRNLIGWERLAGPPETDLIQGVSGYVHKVIEKDTYGAVVEISRWLRSEGIEDVFLCGIDTDVCVLQNAAGLFDEGYAVRVLLDACGTNGGADAARAAIPLLRRTIGRRQVISAND